MMWKAEHHYCSCFEPTCGIVVYTNDEDNIRVLEAPLFVKLDIGWKNAIDFYIFNIYMRTKDFDDESYNIIEDSLVNTYYKLLTIINILILYPIATLHRLFKCIFCKPIVCFDVVLQNDAQSKLKAIYPEFKFTEYGEIEYDIDYKPELFDLFLKLKLICSDFIVCRYSKWENAVNRNIIEEVID